MKKYVKPVLFYEHFELSQHIADCAWELNNTDDCSASPDSGKLPGAPENAFASLGACDYVPEDYCYTTGAPGTNVFKS